MRAVIALTSVLLTVALAGCPKVNGPEPPPPPPGGEPTCETACDRFRLFGCPAGDDTPGGAPCEEVCENTLDGPAALAWDLQCLTDASSCDEGC